MFHLCKQAEAARMGYQKEEQPEEQVGVMKLYIHRYPQSYCQSERAASECPEEGSALSHRKAEEVLSGAFNMKAQRV